MPKWIKFVPVEVAGRKTLRWQVISKDSGGSIGLIEWSTRWRRYCFFSDPDTMFEQVCLRDIADKLEQETTMHNTRLRMWKAGAGRQSS